MVRQRILAVDQVSLDVARGRTLAVVGESGSGKSTLAHLLLGVELPSSGQILLNGQTLGTPRSRAVRRRFAAGTRSLRIDKCCYITCRRLPPFFEYHSRVSYSRIENVTQNDAFEHPSVRACLKYLGVDEGVEIHHVADLPARTGLGTSSAFTVGLLLALYALKDQMRNKHALATDALQVEQEVIREAVGSQDQISAAFGGFNRINFNIDGSFEVKPLLTSPDRLAALQQHCALYFTGFSRTASEIAQEQIRTTPQRKRELDLMYQMVGEAEAIVTNPNRSLT